MLFLNIWLLAGIASISVPIIIHLLNRRSARFINWGAIQFLLDSLVSRRRRILLEEVLLLGSRCLLLALVATAMARPFVPAGTGAAWLIVLPIILLAIVAFGVSFALWQYPRLRTYMMLGALALFALGAGLVMLEHRLNLKRFGGTGSRDVVLIIDASMSMSLSVDGKSNMDRALEEAARIVDQAGRRTAFSVIVGGGVSRSVVPAPVRDKKTLLAAIENIKATGGTMKILDALSAAAVSLSKGSNPMKQVILISDGQAAGWDSDSTAQWQQVADAFKHLPTKPQVVFRRLDLPDGFRNLAVASITTTRNIIGADREVGINVNLMNSGTEAVTPSEVRLRIDGQELVDNTIGQIAPGATETVQFKHRFAKEGSYVLTASSSVNDEMPGDDAASAAVNIVGKLPVLVVDGNPSPRFLERGAAFAAVALAPGARTLMKDKSTSPSREFLVEPELMDAPSLGTVRSFEKYGAVILADVPTVPADVAQLLMEYVRNGGGLLVAPGESALPGFYNGWSMAGGAPVMPARLERRVIIHRDQEPAKPSASTFGHPALKVVSDASQNDVGTVNVTRYWQLKEAGVDEGVTVGARLNTGDPLLVERRIGNGIVLMMAVSLDTRGSNLATKHSFVPIMHELVYFLANPTGVRLNYEPARKLSIALSGNLGRSGSSAAQPNGFRGEYFAGRNFDKPVTTRLDEKIDFSPWVMPQGMAASEFSVRWTGKFRVPRSGQYVFSALADDGVRLYVNGAKLLESWREQPPTEYSGQVQLDASAEHDLRMEYYQGGGGAAAQLFWSGPGVNKQLMPASVIRASGEGLPAGSGAVTETEVAGPDGAKMKAAISVGGAGSVAAVQGDLVPGVYRVAVPPALKTSLAAIAGEDGSVPFTVTRNPEESVLTELSDADVEFVRKFTDMLDAKSLDDVMKVLSGKAFGEELWRPLAVGALFLLLCEILLTRWIARQRRTGQAVKVEFEELGKPSKAFRDQLEKMQAGA